MKEKGNKICEVQSAKSGQKSKPRSLQDGVAISRIKYARKITFFLSIKHHRQKTASN